MKKNICFCSLAFCLLAGTGCLQAQSIARPSEIKTADSLPRFNLNLNVLGVLQYGPIVQGEFRVARSGYLTTSIRIPYLGLIYQLDNVDFSSDYVTVSPVALGIGAGYKVLFPRPRGSWYVGGVAEYSFGSSTGDDGKGWKSEYSHMAFMANGGFRWNLRNPHKTLSVGAYAGVYSSVTDHWWYVNNPKDIREEGGTQALAMIELAFGWGR